MFDINGNVNGDNFSFVKQYRGMHAVHYHGHFEDGRDKMKGHWGMMPGAREGDFKLKYDD